MPTDAFILRGVARVYFVPSVAVLTAPTRLELNAGPNLTQSLAAIGGFAVENQLREFAPVGGSFVEQRPGVNKVSGPCTLTLYEKKTSTSIRAAVTIGSIGYMILLPYGDVVTRRCEVWPGKIASLVPLWDTTTASMFRALFAPSRAPEQNAVLPA